MGLEQQSLSCVPRTLTLDPKPLPRVVTIKILIKIIIKILIKEQLYGQCELQSTVLDTQLRAEPQGCSSCDRVQLH